MPPRVLVTRSPHQSSELADQLRMRGLEPILIPAIELAEPSSFAALDGALQRLRFHEEKGFDWLLFTSANAVNAFFQRLVSTHATSPDQADPKPFVSHIKVAAIGPATARALRSVGIEPDLTPAQAVAESLAESLLPHARQPDGSPARFLLVRAEEAREHLPNTLREAGAEVVIAPAYRTIVPAGSAEAIRELFTGPAETIPAAITFTSSSTARNLLALCEAASVAFPESSLRISIGPITSQTLRELGYPPHAESTEATIAALAETVVKTLQLRTGR